MDWETGVQFLTEISIALMEPDLDLALERVKEAAAGQGWLSYLCLKAHGAGTSDVEVKVGDGEPTAGSSAIRESGAPEHGRIELTGTREGIPVSLVACPNARSGDTVIKEVLSEVLRLFARRLSVHYTAARVRDRELADAVGALSHDFRTPLACIKGYLSLLSGGKHAPGSPEWNEYLDTVMEECERLEKLVSVVLESAVGPRTRLSMEPVLLPPLIKRILLEESAISKGHRFFTDISDGAREIWADPIRLEQVLRNLLDNAIKYSPAGSLIVLRVKKTKDGFLFSVADQGGGIAPEHLNRLFERHYRVDGDAGKVKGTGLGLLIARQIVNAHGGDIWAESVVGKGSTFYFTIPFYEERSSGGEEFE
ncbi:MAG TPA: hypothetical protein GX512_06595 [Firmicutes bacterium]|nr:hypothetical protein [Candidatus Fermentithermobacillaceae bacterium]